MLFFSIVLAISSCIAIAYIISLFSGSPKEPIEKKSLFESKWKKDVVYLYQFSGTPFMSSLSGFCIKVEAFMRIHGIQFERRNSIVTRGPNGKLPLVELNGEQISDSQIIIRRLTEHFNIKDNYGSEEQAALGHGLDRLADNHTFAHLLFFKGERVELLLDAMSARAGPLKPAVTALGSPFFKNKIQVRVENSVGKFKYAHHEELLKNDLLQFQKVLGTKPFLFGDKPTLADCSLFGQITSVYFLNASDDTFLPARLMNSDEFHALREWMGRFKLTVFQDDFCFNQQ